MLIDASGGVLFDMFCLLDGVTDPEGLTGDPWLGMSLQETTTDSPEEPMFLHDQFYASYDEFINSRS